MASRVAEVSHPPGVRGQGACRALATRTRPGDWPQTRFRPWSYSVLIASSLSRLAVIDSNTELDPLIHAPPSLKRSPGKGP